MKRAHLSAIGPYGIIQALGPLYYAALGLAGLSFLFTWASSRPRPLRLSFDLLTLVLLLQSPPAIIEPDARFPTAWLTAGFTDYVSQAGHVLPGIDARFSWPGFFAGVGMIAHATGLPSTTVLLKWWPVALNLLYLPPFYFLARSILGNHRRAALAVWLFPLANWVGQDYFSPQSVAFLVYLVFMWIVVSQFSDNRRSLLPPWPRLQSDGEPRSRPWPRSEREDYEGYDDDEPPTVTFPRLGSRPETEGSPRQGALPPVFGLTVLTLLAFAMIVSHQITPVFASLAVILLAFFGRTKLRAFPVLMLLSTFGWICFAAVTFWAGHFNLIFGGVGNLGGNLNASLSNRLSGSPQHRLVVDVRLIDSCVIWGLAALGFLVGRLSRSRLDIRTPAVLMITPLLALSGGAYGGEAGLRAYLFSLVGALPLVSMLFPAAMPAWSARAVRSAFATALVMALLAPAFVLSRWGNELAEMARPDELTGIRALYRIAPHHATLISIAPVSWRFADIDAYHYVSSKVELLSTMNISDILHESEINRHGGYVLITTAELEYAMQTYDQPTDWGTELERALTSSHRFFLVYSNPDTKIYEFRRPPKPKPKPHRITHPHHAKHLRHRARSTQPARSGT